jgi:hypothetical protein
MKKKVNRNSFPELDKFDRKQKKRAVSHAKGSKQKYSIYDDYNDEDNDLLGYNTYLEDDLDMDV